MSSESGGQIEPSVSEQNQPYTVNEPDPPPLESPTAGEKVAVMDNVKEEKNIGQSTEEEVCYD